MLYPASCVPSIAVLPTVALLGICGCVCDGCEWIYTAALFRRSAWVSEPFTFAMQVAIALCLLPCCILTIVALHCIER